MRNLVTVRKYSGVLEAQMGKAQLEAGGVGAFVIEAGSYSPVMAAAFGTELQVREGDLSRAEAILRERPPEAVDDGEAAGVVRCPRCELAYCYYERPGLALSPGQVSLLTVLAYPLLFLWPKRWRCHKCEYVWDEASSGPKSMTPLPEGAPRPVFRLGRAHSGMGLFLGFMAGVLIAMVGMGAFRAGSTEAQMLGMMLFVGPFAGWFIGRNVRRDVCSDPTCRAVLHRGAEECAGCKGAIAGTIQRSSEHFSAAAEFRRELAQMADPRKKKRRST